VPERTCIGCRRRLSAGDLVRIVWSASDGCILIGAGHPGRGAWLCPTADCVDAAKQGRAFGRALRADIPHETIEALLSDGLGGSIRPPEPGGKLGVVLSSCG
jgi:predicted RNA-binding protein YlxR (DUF448 family)